MNVHINIHRLSYAAEDDAFAFILPFLDLKELRHLSREAVLSDSAFKCGAVGFERSRSEIPPVTWQTREKRLYWCGYRFAQRLQILSKSADNGAIV